MRGRKFAVQVSSSLDEEAEGIFNCLSLSYDIHYLGVYEVEGSIFMYVHAKNMVSGQNIKKAIEKTGIELDNISVCNEFKGEVKTEFGTKFTRGGYRERKKNHPKAKKEGSTASQITSGPPAPAVQPATSLPTPFRKVPNSLTILDNVYYRTISGPTNPNSFHAVWSSDGGLWFPAMWVGPVRNIFPVPRGNIRSSVVADLLKEQSQKCRLCRTDVFMGVYSNADVDHIIPLSYGGSCHKGNLQVLCVTCHRRKTALECKKVVAVMGSGNVTWLDGIIYLTNTHVHFDVGFVSGKNPKDALDSLGSKPGVFVLDY